MFKDEDKAWPDAVAAIQRVMAAGLMQGDPDGNFRPTDAITRQEMALILDREMLLEQELEDSDRVKLLQRIANSVVMVRTGTSIGSGVVITTQGHILTNAHVVGDATMPEVVWVSPYAASRFPQTVGPIATILAVDTANDLALLQVGSGEWTEPAQIASNWVDARASNQEHIGQRLILQGAPLGLTGRVAEGIFNGVRYMGGQSYVDIDVHVNPGNSGGPVFNTAGQLVGLVVAKLVDLAFEGAGLAIPLSRIMPFLQSAGVAVPLVG